MGAALLFAKSYWQYIVIMLLVGALYVANEGRKDAVNDLALVVAQNETAIAKFKQKNAEDALADVQFHQSQTEKFNGQKNALVTTLDATTGELRAAKAKYAAASKPEPVRVAANFCSQPDAGRRLYDAIQSAQSAIADVARSTAGAIKDYQIGLGESIVSPAAFKQLEATELREYAIRGNKVNAVAK